MFLPSSPLLSSSLASSTGPQSPRYSSQLSLSAPSSFIRSHPLFPFNFLDMDPHLIPQSLPETNPSSSLHQASRGLSDPMLSTTSHQPSIAFYSGQMSGLPDYGLPSYNPSTAPDLQSNFLLDESAFRPHDGLGLSPHLAELQLGLINPGFDHLLQCSTNAALHPPDPDQLPQQNQPMQIFSFQPSTNTSSTVSSDSIPRASQNSISDYSSGLGFPYHLDLQAASLPNLDGFLSCFDTRNTSTNFPPTTLAPDPETSLLPDDSLSEQQIHVNGGRCGADWNSFGSSSPSSADERPSSPGELAHGPSLFFFSTPPLRRQGMAGQVERGIFGTEPITSNISGAGGVNPMELDGYRPEEFFGDALRGPWWAPPPTEEDDRRCSSGSAERVARAIFGPGQPSSSGPTRKARGSTSNRRTGGILLGSEQVPDYSLMPTKRSRGRRPPVSPEVGLPMADGSVAVGAGMQAVPGGQAFDPSLNPASEAVKFCELTKTGKPKKIFVCQVRGCGKCFKRSEHLKRHVRSIHTNHKPYRCPWIACTKSFSRHDNLNQHLRVHRVEEGGEVLNGLHVSSDGVLRSDSGEVRVEPESRGLRNVEVGEGASGFGFS